MNHSDLSEDAMAKQTQGWRHLDRYLFHSDTYKLISSLMFPNMSCVNNLIVFLMHRSDVNRTGYVLTGT